MANDNEMPVLIIYNPACGDRTAQASTHEHVLPLLELHGKQVARVAATERAGHAGDLVLEVLTSRNNSKGDVTVIVASGDGTIHEIVNALASKSLSEEGGARVGTVRFVLIPCGTANALYSSLFPQDPTKSQDPIAYKLLGVRSYISGSRILPLRLAKTTLPTVETGSTTVYSAVVTSTSLHASILHDSEALRAEMPGIERFKVAAQRNITRWYRASVRLLPTVSGSVEVYDPSTNAFVPSPEQDEAVTLSGPFAYFLSTVNVDRLEPAFRITPLATSLPPPSTTATMEVIVVRPHRDPSIPPEEDAPEATRAAFASKSATVLGDAYRDGAHVHLRYGASGEVTSGARGDEPTVVEYFRCGGWEWRPQEDEAAHILCADGTIFRIHRGGAARCEAIASANNVAGFAVYA